jgi:hypothetical protein
MEDSEFSSLIEEDLDEDTELQQAEREELGKKILGERFHESS